MYILTVFLTKVNLPGKARGYFVLAGRWLNSTIGPTRLVAGSRSAYGIRSISSAAGPLVFYSRIDKYNVGQFVSGDSPPLGVWNSENCSFW